MAESFLSLREDFVLSSAVGGVSYLVRGGNTGRLAPFQTFLGNVNAYELWDETHICQGASLLWASRDDESSVSLLCQIWTSPKVTGQNHLPGPCLVPRISHALSHQTVRFTTTHSPSFPTFSTGPCACFVPSHKTPILEPKVSTHGKSLSNEDT